MAPARRQPASAGVADAASPVCRRACARKAAMRLRKRVPASAAWRACWATPPRSAAARRRTSRPDAARSAIAAVRPHTMQLLHASGAPPTRAATRKAGDIRPQAARHGERVRALPLRPRFQAARLLPQDIESAPRRNCCRRMAALPVPRARGLRNYCAHPDSTRSSGPGPRLAERARRSHPATRRACPKCAPAMANIRPRCGPPVRRGSDRATSWAGHAASEFAAIRSTRFECDGDPTTGYCRRSAGRTLTGC